MSKLDINTNNAFSDIDLDDVVEVFKRVVKIIGDWRK
jgi:hypothetical protein